MLLDWSQADLARESGVSEPTIKRLEAQGNELGGRTDTAEKIIGTLEAEGVIFLADGQDGGTAGGGVRLVQKRKGAKK